MEQKKKFSLKKWWQEARPTKTAVFWSWVACCCSNDDHWLCLGRMGDRSYFPETG